MRKLLSLSLITVFALTLGACKDFAPPTDVEAGSELRASSSTQSNPDGGGSGVVFQDNFFTGIAVFDASEGILCVGKFPEEDINDLNNFIKQQPNGHWSVHIEDHETQYTITTPSGVFTGSGQATASATFSQNPLTFEGDIFDILLNSSVQGTGTVENGDGDVRHVVCKSQFNQQGNVFSRVRLN